MLSKQQQLQTLCVNIQNNLMFFDFHDNSHKIQISYGPGYNTEVLNGIVAVVYGVMNQ